jgi:hypothetical protein
MPYFTRGTFTQNCRDQPSYNSYVANNYAHKYYKNRPSGGKFNNGNTTKSLTKSFTSIVNKFATCKSRYVYTRSS